MAFLEIKSGARSGERLRLSKERTVIGRHPACDIVVDVSAVSRQHAAVTIAGDECFNRLRQGFASDMTQARALAPAHSAPCGAVFILPHAKWSRRVNGVFANELAREAPTRAHAILVDTGAAYLVSVRAPKAAPRGADTLCRGFVTGGGRAAAAGINALPAAEVPRFLAAFDAAFR